MLHTPLPSTRGPFWVQQFKAILVVVPPFDPLRRPFPTVLFGRCLPIMKLRFMSRENPKRLHRCEPDKTFLVGNHPDQNRDHGLFSNIPSFKRRGLPNR